MIGLTLWYFILCKVKQTIQDVAMSVYFSRQKRTYLYAPLILLFIASVVDASYAASYVINPNNTNVRFAIERFKTAATTGGFYNVKGQLQYDPNLKTGDISLTIPMSSLSTGNRIFDNKLMGADFFNTQIFPLAHFKSTNWYFNKDKVNPQLIRVDGNLTLHGETHPISLMASKFSCSQISTAKKKVCGGEFATKIDRTKWNINKYSLFGLTKNLDLKVKIEALEQ